MHNQLYSAHGIVLKRRNWGESDKIVTVFTKEYGKIRLLAKGVRKINSKRSPYLEPFRSIFFLAHKSMRIDHVVEVSPQKSDEIWVNLETIGYAYFACEIIDKMIADADIHNDIYENLSSVLYSLKTSTDITQCKKNIELFAHTILIRLGFLQESDVKEFDSVVNYIENIIEKRLKSPKIIGKFSQLRTSVSTKGK